MAHRRTQQPGPEDGLQSNLEQMKVREVSEVKKAGTDWCWEQEKHEATFLKAAVNGTGL